MRSGSLILVVDDEPSVARTLQMVFEREGYEVLAAHSCAQALTILRDGSQIDVVVTDLNMERADIGLDVARAAKNMKPPAAVVVCTGYANLENTKASLNMQVDYLATKPTDLDEMKRVVREIISRRTAQRITVEKMKDEFVTIVSHELRTPLTSLRLSLGLLTSGKLGAVSAEAKRVLAMGLANATRLMRLLDGILDVQRLESGLIPLERRRCNVSDLIVQASDLMRPIAQQSSVNLEFKASDIFIDVDQDRIVQTLTNLLSNAIKFSPENGIVTVSAEARGEFLLVQVTDQGRGIAAENVDLVFERFQQVDTSDSREKGGVGLGLAISRSIVQQHGGQIWVESVLGMGSTFSFTIPLRQSTS